MFSPFFNPTRCIKINLLGQREWKKKQEQGRSLQRQQALIKKKSTKSDLKMNRIKDITTNC